jgi:hypothetical protein
VCCSLEKSRIVSEKKTMLAQGRHTIGTDIEKRNSFVIFPKKVVSRIATNFPSLCTSLGSQNMSLVNGDCLSMLLREV